MEKSKVIINHPFCVFLKDFCVKYNINYADFSILKNVSAGDSGLEYKLYYKKSMWIYLYSGKIYKQYDFEHVLNQDKLDFYNSVVDKIGKKVCQLKKL